MARAASVWVVGLTAATVAIGRYSDGQQPLLWCGLAVLLAAWVAWQGFMMAAGWWWRYCLHKWCCHCALLRLPHLRY